VSTAGIITGIGAANMDVHGASRNPLILRDSNPGDIRLSVGGVTRNMIENLARMGARTRLLTAVGNDSFGREILCSVEKLGCDVSHCKICPDRSSSTYLAVLDSLRDMQVAISDMHILEEITPAWLDTKLNVLRDSTAIVLDPCLPEAALEWLTDGRLNGVPLFADTVSTTYARKLRPYIGSLYCLKPNCMELEAMTGISVNDDRQLARACAALLDAGLQRVVVTLGARGSYWADRDGNVLFHSINTVKNMKSATGAGDSFLAGLTYAYVQGLSPEESLDWATACGMISVMSPSAINEKMSTALIRKTVLEMK